MMKIALDAKRAFHNPTGLGNFSRWMIAIYESYFSTDELLLLSPAISKSSYRPGLSSTQILDHGRGLQAACRRTFPLKQLMANEVTHYHGMSNELPLQMLRKHGIKSVLTVHDLIFKQYPNYYSAIDRNLYDFKMRAALKKADLVHCISESTANDLQHFYGLGEKRIRIIPLGNGIISPLVSVQGAPYTSTAPYLLCVSSFEDRKNLLRLIRAFAISNWHNAGQLIIAGKKGNTLEDCLQLIAQLGLQKEIICIASPELSELASLYKGATAFVYPSEFEGFGIPLLEAMSFALPMACSNTSSLPEVGGNAALYFDPLSIDSISEGLNQLFDQLTDEAYLEKVRMQFESFNDANIAAKWQHVYQELA